MPQGLLVILSGPSGVGKDTLIDAWRQFNASIVRVVACTTRKPRKNEVDGIDYHFLNETEFEQKILNSEFLEYKKVHQSYYGTPISQVESLLQDNKVAILKIDVQGALEVMDNRDDAISIFILPPSTKELKRRLTSRQTDSPEQVQIRLETALKEIELADQYQYKVVNENITTAVEQLQQIISRKWQTSSSE